MDRYQMTRVSECENITREVRKDIINMIYSVGMGHPGSSLSCVEILVGLYFGGYMNVNPKLPKWSERDRLVLSKGHASPTLYSVLAHKGFFEVEDLKTFRKTDSMLTAYPDILTPGVDMESGSLGNGLSTAVGMAISAKMKKRENYVYVILGDGELQEGMVWEAAMCAAHHNLDNIIAIVDKNQLQITGTVEEVMSISPLEDKWKSFGWNVLSVDGHDFNELFKVYDCARSNEGKPTVIIANTIKGKGVSYMENVLYWHRAIISDIQYEQAMRELNDVKGGQ